MARGFCYQYNTAAVYNKGNLLSAKYNKCVDQGGFVISREYISCVGQGGFGISTMQLVCRPRGIWYRQNISAVQDKGDLASAQYSRCVGHEGFGISTMQQVYRTRGVWYQRIYVPALYDVNGITTVFITMQYLCMYYKLCDTNIYVSKQLQYYTT